MAAKPDVVFTSLTGGGLTVPAGTQANPGTKTFTLVAVPDTFSDLTVACTSSGTTTTIKLKHNSQFYSFAAGKKHNIAIELPDFSSASVSSFTIYFGGTLVSDSPNNSQNPNPFETPWTNADNNKQKIFPYTTYSTYIDEFASVPTGGNHLPIRGRSDHVELDYFGPANPTSYGHGIIIKLKQDWIKTPSRIEIDCSAQSSGGKMFVSFTSTSAAVSGSSSPLVDVATTRQTLPFTLNTTPSIPTTQLQYLKIQNKVRGNPVSIYSITVYYNE